MSNKSNNFSNHDLRSGAWYIKGGSMITEVAFEKHKKRQVSSPLPKDIALVPNMFKVIDPIKSDQIPDHICFEYTNLSGHTTHVYVHEDNVMQKTADQMTWVDNNRWL